MDNDANRIEVHGIGWAVNQLRHGRRVFRKDTAGRWLGLQLPNANSILTQPYIYMRTSQDQFVPWVASQADILAIDWEVVSQGGGGNGA